MKQNEIRVGNCLIDPRAYDKELNKKFGVDDSPYFKVTARDIQFAEEYKPIPLTEETFLKCVFKKKNGYKFVLHNSHFSLVMIDSINREDYAFSHYNLWVNLEHVHQLQNLYFALTGQELEVNL